MYENCAWSYQESGKKVCYPEIFWHSLYQASSPTPFNPLLVIRTSMSWPSYESNIWYMKGCQGSTAAVSQPLPLCFRMVILAFFTHLSKLLSSLSNMCTLLSSKEFPLSFKWRQTAASRPVGFALSWLCFISWSIGLCICHRFGLHIALTMFGECFFIEGKFLTSWVWKTQGRCVRWRLSDTPVMYGTTYLHCFSPLRQSALSNSSSFCVDKDPLWVAASF